MASTSTTGGGVSLRRLVLTGAFAAVTIVGTIYGAGLKTQQEAKTERKKLAEATIEQRIALLEERRARLLTAKLPLDRKMAALRERMREMEEGSSGAGGK